MLLKWTLVRRMGAGPRPDELAQGVMEESAGSPIPPTLQQGLFSDSAPAQAHCQHGLHLKEATAHFICKLPCALTAFPRSLVILFFSTTPSHLSLCRQPQTQQQPHMPVKGWRAPQQHPRYPSIPWLGKHRWSGRQAEDPSLWRVPCTTSPGRSAAQGLPRVSPRCPSEAQSERHLKFINVKEERK